MDFSELDLPHEVRQGIEHSGFKTCTPVQEAVLPRAIRGEDVAAQAQTGTGKTAAFLISLFTRMVRNPVVDLGNSPQALIIAPTRELADQIFHEAERLGKFTGFRSLAVYGGIDYDKQRQALANGVDVLIGTPGRLIDYFKQHVYSLKKTRYLIIDEADRMFDMGFIDDLRYLLKKLPDYTRRQSMLFSATLSYRVMELAYEHMNLPEKISITPEQVTVEKVEQVLYHVGKHEKVPLLLGLLAREAPARALIFVNTRRAADMVVERLNRNNWKAQAITGDIEQKKRLRILGDFKEGRLAILVATDVASRGIDVKDVTHVFNYDLPQDAEDYVHRIGRTGRAGATGKALSLACEEYVFSLESIEQFIGQKIPVDWADEGLFVKEIRRTHEERQKSERERALRPPQPGRHRTSDRPRPRR
ncbi:MAG: rhlB [Nitrospirae bacterium]|nr:rhlB [Nitrospirota bacterium]MBS1243393.1 rhlB [Nitrospirota bacterium]